MTMQPPIQTWTRWNSGHKAIWHARREHLIFGRWVTDSTTLCGRGVPAHAITFNGSIIGDSVPPCKKCQEIFLREKGI